MTKRIAAALATATVATLAAPVQAQTITQVSAPSALKGNVQTETFENSTLNSAITLRGTGRVNWNDSAYAYLGNNNEISALFNKPGIRSVGFEFGSDYSGEFRSSPDLTLVADIYGASGLVGSSSLLANRNVAIDQFLGFNTDFDITKINIRYSDPTFLKENGYIAVTPAIDNLRFGTNLASAVPEPATWGMMIAGAAMTGAAMRHRRIAEALQAA